MKNNKNAQELIDECSDNQLSQRANTLTSLPNTLPQYAFKLSYSQKQENYAEKLVEEIKNA
ncbi:MAG: hypothetical protein NT055_02245 [Nitrospirae bacterium]|nr:hypothetical protein [Nitrospirota bacterium]